MELLDCWWFETDTNLENKFPCCDGIRFSLILLYSLLSLRLLSTSNLLRCVEKEKHIIHTNAQEKGF